MTKKLILEFKDIESRKAFFIWLWSMHRYWNVPEMYFEDGKKGRKIK